MVAIVALTVWRMHTAIVFLVWLLFAAFDGLYLTSAATKVPNGAWFTFMLAMILTSFFAMWRYGKENQWVSEAAELNDLNSLVKSVDGKHLALTERLGGGKLAEVDGFGIFFDKAGCFAPKVYEQWLTKFKAQMDFVVLMHMRALSIPHVSDEDRFEVAQTSVKSVYRLIIRHGYGDHVITPDLAGLVYKTVRKAIVHGNVTTPPLDVIGMPSTSDVLEKHVESGTVDANTAYRLRRIDDAFASQSLYLVGKQKMRINPKYNILKRMVLGLFLWIRENSRSKIEKLDVPVQNLVEIGFVREI